jgi:hypothetical protein
MIQMKEKSKEQQQLDFESEREYTRKYWNDEVDKKSQNYAENGWLLKRGNDIGKIARLCIIKGENRDGSIKALNEIQSKAREYFEKLLNSYFEEVVERMDFYLNHIDSEKK